MAHNYKCFTHFFQLTFHSANTNEFMLLLKTLGQEGDQKIYFTCKKSIYYLDVSNKTNIFSLLITKIQCNFICKYDILQILTIPIIFSLFLQNIFTKPQLTCYTCHYTETINQLALQTN